MNADCIFCKIINGEAACYRIYEDKYRLAFLDVSNDVEGHTLVVPKKHFENILDCDEETLSQVMKTVQAVSTHFTENCGYDGINILNANKEAAQQSVFHLHFHIIPRKKKDKIDAWITANMQENEKNSLEKLCEKLKL